MAGRKRKTASPLAAPPGPPAGTGPRSDAIRMRAAWMYYIEEMTQSDIADALAIGRVSVVRLLADARARGEVRISVVGEMAESARLERGLEAAFSLERAIVAPLSRPDADPVPPISAAIGAYLSAVVRPGMTVGLGWGRTLLQSLPFIESRPLENLSVISLLGGITQARRFNPAEFVWRFAQVFAGDAFLLTAPALVDSADTKRALIERCGLKPVIDMADALDLVVASVGGMGRNATTFRVGFISEEVRRSLEEAGAVGDLLFHFFDRDGRLVDHPLNELVMSVGVERMRAAERRVLASGGPEKVEALLGAMSLLRPTVFVTDEVTARIMLKEGA